MIEFTSALEFTFAVKRFFAFIHKISRTFYAYSARNTHSINYPPHPFLSGFPSELPPVRSACRNHLLLLFKSLDNYRHLIVIGANQCLTSFKLGNGTDFRRCQFQHLFHIACLIRLQIENNLIIEI